MLVRTLQVSQVVCESMLDARRAGGGSTATAGFGAWPSSLQEPRVHGAVPAVAALSETGLAVFASLRAGERGKWFSDGSAPRTSRPLLPSLAGECPGGGGGRPVVAVGPRDQ